MIDEHQVREMLHRRANAVTTIVVDAPKATRRARRRLLAIGAIAMLAAVAIAVATLAGMDAIRSAPIPADLPTPSPHILRANGEVLNFTGARGAPGDLVAVNPETRGERVIVENLDDVVSATWSADGRWVAYETFAPDTAGGTIELWVVGASQEPRRVATGGNPDLFASLGLYWMWSPRGAELATIDHSTLNTIDPVTGETTDLGTIGGDPEMNIVTSAWSWSPDGTRIALVTPGGAISAVDMRSGERSLLVRLPGENLDSINEIDWSPEGAHVAVGSSSKSSSTGRLYVMDADGSDVRVLVDDLDARGVAWSPDGTRLAFADWSAPDRNVRIWVAPMDGSAPADIGSLAASCRVPYKCGLTWSPDGSRIAFMNESGVHEAGGAGVVSSVIDADGRGDAVSIDELTYRSWDGGGY